MVKQRGKVPLRDTPLIIPRNSNALVDRTPSRQKFQALEAIIALSTQSNDKLQVGPPLLKPSPNARNSRKKASSPLKRRTRADTVAAEAANLREAEPEQHDVYITSEITCNGTALVNRTPSKDKVDALEAIKALDSKSTRGRRRKLPASTKNDSPTSTRSKQKRGSAKRIKAVEDSLKSESVHIVDKDYGGESADGNGSASLTTNEDESSETETQEDESGHVDETRDSAPEGTASPVSVFSDPLAMDEYRNDAGSPECRLVLEDDVVADDIPQKETEEDDFEAGKCHCCLEDILTAHKGGQFKCPLCPKTFKLEASLERHKKVIHHEGESHECPQCGARCADKGTLARHMYTHTGLKPYSCDKCKKTFSRKFHLDRHMSQTGCDGLARPTFPCQVCGKLFARKDNLREHLRAHAGQVRRKKNYTCKYCGKTFCGSSLLQVHLRTHTGERPYPCEYCEKSFPSSGSLTKHVRVHTGERPYECKECFARFSMKETLNRHERTHTGLKPHACQYCGKTFIQPAQLRAHIFHHTGENGYPCDRCEKTFNRKSRLKMHYDFEHLNIRPWSCEECGKAFVRKEDLARHRLVHTGLRAHQCPVCEKAFSIKSSLKLHLLVHTKEVPRSCEECGRAFIRQDRLLRHMKMKHRDTLEQIMAEVENKKLQSNPVPTQSIDGEAPDAGPLLDEEALSTSLKELMSLLVDEATLRSFGWPDQNVEDVLGAVIRRCGHEPLDDEELPYCDKLRENAKLLFTVVIDDSAVKTLLSNQTVDEVILHVLRLAKS